MAVRLNKRHQDSVRAKIKTSMHLTSLHKNAVGKMNMTATAQKSAIFLIEQSIGKAPQTIEQTVDGELVIKVINYADHNDPE